MTVYIEKTATATGGLDMPAQLSRELRRADPFIKYAVLAANAIFEKVTVANKLDTENCGLFLGSAYGPMETNFDVLNQVVNHEQTSPTLFSHSVFNAAAGYLARIFQLHGSALTITDFAFPFFHALQQAIISIESGQIASCFVLQVETYSTLLDDARKKIYQTECTQPVEWHPGACAWFLSNKAMTSQPQRIDKLSITASSALPESLLKIEEVIDINGLKVPLTSPLDAAFEISKAIHDDPCKNYSITLRTPYKEVILTTSNTTL